MDRNEIERVLSKKYIIKLHFTVNEHAGHLMESDELSPMNAFNTNLEGYLYIYTNK